MAKKNEEQKPKPVTKKTMFVAVNRDNLGSLGSSDGFQYDSIKDALESIVCDLGATEGYEIVIAKVTVEDPILYTVQTKPAKSTEELDFSNV